MSLGLGSLLVGTDVNGVECHHRVANDVTPSQISSEWCGFAVRTDWRISDPNAARRHPTSHPPQVLARCRNRIGAPRRSHKLVRNVTKARFEVFRWGVGQEK